VKARMNLLEKGLQTICNFERSCTRMMAAEWLVLKDRATKIAEKVLPPDLLHKFKASDGFIEKVLRRNNLIGVSLHGEGNDISDEEAEALMRPFRVELGELCEKHNIPIERIYGCDQFALYFQKLPNRIYCEPKERATIRGVKQMKDKNRITGMNCTSAGGLRMEVAIVGQAERPQCWDLCDNRPPLPYIHQKNAWFD